MNFGQFHFDQAARRLTKAFEPIHLTSKAVDLLTLLSSRHPDAVAKKEIHQHLWPDTFVSDVSLTTLIFELRSALGLARLYVSNGRAAPVSDVLAPVLVNFDAGQDLPEIEEAEKLLRHRR